jgi:hypothetical protein
LICGNRSPVISPSPALAGVDLEFRNAETAFQVVQLFEIDVAHDVGDGELAWFARDDGQALGLNAYQALWWIPAGHQATVAEAVAKLEHLRKHGPSAEAFTFGEAFAAPDAHNAGTSFSIKDGCPA